MSDYLTDADVYIKEYLASHKIPSSFYQCFFGELIKVFGISFLIPNKDYLAEYDENGNVIPSEIDDYSYIDQIDFYLTHFGGTGGWSVAFKESCAQCNLIDIYQDYCNFNWVKSDIFDGYIAENMIKALFVESQKTPKESAHQERTMTKFQAIKHKNIDELAAWFEANTWHNNSPWDNWFDKKCCQNCPSVYTFVPFLSKEAECAYCEPNGKCKFFPDLDGVPKEKSIIKMWLESEDEDR